MVILLGLTVAAGCGSSSNAGTAGPSSTAATAASSAKGAVGITPTTITLGQLADVTGPVPGLFSGAVDGMDAWAAYVNSTGGLDGRKVIIDHKDSALDCSTYSNGLKAQVTTAFANVGTYSSADVCGETVLKANPGYLDLQGAVLNPAIEPLANVFAPIPAPNGYATTVYQWVKDTYGLSAIQHTGTLWGSTNEFNFKEQQAAAESIGYKYIYSRGFAPTESNYTADILRMKAEGVQVVENLDTDAAYVADLLQQMAQQNFHPKAVINSSGYDPSFFKLLGNPADAAPLVLSLPFSLFLGQDSATVPAVATFTSWMHKTHPGEPVNLYALEAWSAGVLFQQAFDNAGSDPTRASVTAALSKISSFSANGLLAPTNPGAKIPSACEVIAGARDGKFVRLDPATKGFDCDGKFQPYAGSST